MVRDLVVYPDKRIHITSPDVRSFGEALDSVIQDIKDTMEAHNAKAMAAIQIAIPMAVIVIKQEDGSYLEIINPRIIGKKGSVDSTEDTLYFPGTPHTVKRYEQIRLIYQDRTGEQKSMKAEGDLGILLQRKIDYVFGDTLASRVSASDRKELEKILADKGFEGSFETCPTVMKHDYIKSFIQKVLFFMFLGLFAPLFDLAPETLASVYTFEKIATVSVLGLLVAYVWVALREAKKYSSCTSCQTGNIIGIVGKHLIVTILLFAVAFYLFS